jgi:hypothetical protein
MLQQADGDLFGFWDTLVKILFSNPSFSNRCLDVHNAKPSVRIATLFSGFRFTQRDKVRLQT